MRPEKYQKIEFYRGLLIAKQVEFEAMKIANEEREINGLSIAYGEEAFRNLQEEIEQISYSLLNVK